MNIKEELIKLRESIKDAFLSKQMCKSEEMSKDCDPLSLQAVIDGFERLTAAKQNFTENTITPAAKALSEHFNSRVSSPDNLDDKVDTFINWYTENMVKGNYTDIGEYHEPRKVRNFIEKMAVWYELRYPDYEIDRIFNPEKSVEKDVNEEMFIKNPMTQEMINESGDWGKWNQRVLSRMEWDEFYNTKAFINSLPWDEKYFLSKAKYNRYVKLFMDDYDDIHIYLNPNGNVENIEDTYIYPLNGKYLISEDLIGKKIKDVTKLLEEKYNCTKEQLRDIKKEIQDVDNYKYFKEELLNCVMYRIIERGGSIHGARRAFIFAQEFNRNIDIPMMYGACLSYPGIEEFVNLYLEAGGNEDLTCFTNYTSRASKKEQLNTIEVKKILELK